MSEWQTTELIFGWRPVVGWEDAYEVHRSGIVRRLAGARLNPWKNGNGYAVVRLTNLKRGQRRMALLHRLVAEAFIANPAGKPFINHIDCNPANNEVTNLEWCTQKENIHHCIALGRKAPSFWKGKRSPAAVLSDQQVAEIRKIYADGGAPYSKLAHIFGISKRAVGRVVHRQAYVYVPPIDRVLT